MIGYRIADFDVDLRRDLFLIAGPCVIESREHTFFMARELKRITAAKPVFSSFSSGLIRQGQSHVDQVLQTGAGIGAKA